MTGFDLIAVALIALSAIAGFMRGAVRELVGLFALTLSAFGTIALLPHTAPIARHFVHSPWLAAAAAAMATFVAIFIVLRLLAGALTASLDRAVVLGGANRMAGLVFGGLRGLVFLGLFALVFNRVTPGELRPRWITASLLYPVARGSGRALQTLMPQGMGFAGGLTPALGDAVNAAGADASPSSVREEGSDSEPPRRKGGSMEGVKMKDRGYTKRARDSVDALVERSN